MYKVMKLAPMSPCDLEHQLNHLCVSNKWEFIGADNGFYIFKVL
jgi:hypothetical protein